MTPMQACINIDIDEIYNIDYPCYIAGIPPFSQRIAHIPGEFEYKYLDGIRSHVLEAYKAPDDRLWIFDVIPIHLWKKGICKISYEKRLKFIRTICTAQIADFKNVMDLPTVLVDNPPELADYCESLLTTGYKTARIMDVNGNYVFGECQNYEYMELKL